MSMKVMEKKTCKHCKKILTPNPLDFNSLYCSLECLNDFRIKQTKKALKRRAARHIIKKNTPHYQSPNLRVKWSELERK